MASMVFRLRAVTGGYAGVAVPRPQAGAFVFNRNADLLGLIVVIFGVVWSLDRNVLRTKVGRAFLALRQDEEVAGALGIDVAGYKLYAFALYGAVAAAAGSVLGHVVGFAQQETFRFDLSLLFIVIVLIGGIRSRLGVALAAFMFGATPRFFGFLRGWELVLAPAFVLLTLVRHPGGLGRALHEMRGLARRRAVAGGQDRPNQDDSPVSLVLPRPQSSAGNGGALEVQGLVVHFGGVTAVDGISFGVEAGTITGLIGPNGAGKTTAFNAISGFVRPQAGRVLLNGRDISGEPAHRRAALGIGRTFQHIGLIKDLSVSENLVLAQHRLASYNPLLALLHPRPVARAERGLREHAVATLCALRLERFADTPFAELSHGQQRIVELAAGLLTAPGVLLLDEPSAGMSPAAAEALAQRLIQVRDELGQTILLIEHHLPLVLATCTVVHVMDAGRLLLTGTPDEVRSSPAVIDAYLGGRRA
jgi:sulfate-transporting ATPase